jgi:tetratricopeptide (TPR) repeat protein
MTVPRLRLPTLTLALAALLIFTATPSRAAGHAQYCGDLANAFGPFDYRNGEFANSLAIVEQAHFTDDVENGVRGNTGTLGGDLGYVLRAFPNHPRALEALARITLRQKVTELPGAPYPTECFFERAIRFVPDDGAPRAAYANYLHALGRDDKALPLLEQAAGLAPDNAAIQYNLGLAYARGKRYDKAVAQAKKAYALGFPLPGLRQMLVDAGKWDGKQQ